MNCECGRGPILEGNGTPDVCRQCWNELTCWNCRRPISQTLPRHRRHRGYCNPCGMMVELGEGVKLRQMRQWYGA